MYQPDAPALRREGGLRLYSSLQCSSGTHTTVLKVYTMYLSSQAAIIFVRMQGGNTSHSGLQGHGGVHVQHPTLLGNLHVRPGLQPHAQKRRH